MKKPWILTLYVSFYALNVIFAVVNGFHGNYIEAAISTFVAGGLLASMAILKGA